MIKTSTVTTLCAGVTFMTSVAAGCMAYALRANIETAIGFVLMIAFAGAAIISLAGQHEEG